ncbi:MAG: hypothetical protein JRD89_04855 [Deltaproteobacteria bacterium]|nr:hypothetical protein [Deltaproteobacteria bacterium]
MRETFVDKCSRVIKKLRDSGKEKQVTRQDLDAAIRGELLLWRNEHVLGFIRTMEAAGYIRHIQYGVYELVKHE